MVQSTSLKIIDGNSCVGEWDFARGVTSSNPDEIYDFYSQFAFFSSVSNIIFYLKKRKSKHF